MKTSNVSDLANFITKYTNSIFISFQNEWKSQGKQVELEFLDPLEQGLIALQGPKASLVLQRLVKTDLCIVKFMNSIQTKLDGVPIRISRCGYTGEDGFEISVPAASARTVAERILQDEHVKLAGLGARDSLR